MFYNMWNPPDCFRLPAKACRPQPRLRLLDRLFTVQGLVTNHEQGRVNLLSLPKNIPADSGSIIASGRNGFKQNVLEIFRCGEQLPMARQAGSPLFITRMIAAPRGGYEMRSSAFFSGFAFTTAGKWIWKVVPLLTSLVTVIQP